MTFKDMKYELIVDKVTELFLEKGINEVTIKDVANLVGLGEATIYRYFTKKENLVVEVATKLELMILDKFFKNENIVNGYQSIYNFYNSFLDVFVKRVEFYRFIGEFDNFILNKDCNLSEYEAKIGMFYQIFIDGYNKGLEDGSVKKIEDINAFYLTTTHALMGLCKKLASSDILVQDENIDKEKEIKMLIDIIMINVRP